MGRGGEEQEVHDMFVWYNSNNAVKHLSNRCFIIKQSTWKRVAR